ncbi:benenodin family lasso peptide [Sphingomonas glacialis]|uniref:Benenodin family lasso peptide n=1 Tax=Sphingomonas glacialis TaxID=658225 RepID=A0A502G4N8_9SPHN|nr:benenodin family lasso peptide [Sphingomonas glacialis]TPG56521.1 benenodin family lasso peptide [Sphingomonas glacialis]
MNREHEDTIELGVVSSDTKGVTPGIADLEFGQQLPMGLSDD